MKNAAPPNNLKGKDATYSALDLTVGSLGPATTGRWFRETRGRLRS